MYSDVGKSIKKFASVMVWIGVFVSAIAGIRYCVYMFELEEYLLGLVLFPVVFLAGGFLSWLSMMVLYGFGELIDKVTAIEKDTRYFRLTNKEDNGESKSVAGNNSSKDEYIEKACPKCGERLVFSTVSECIECPACGAKFSLVRKD